ncbi:unnamed protein product [Aspergillus oryzae]|uniref:Unnamed protein product n=2 Tax=Aspergillus oryzae TaxID=5062 RepID=A0AAN5BU49_ASPOZ|nr:unnamed protein product [Aspergillus oryzae]GMF96112.1 unnamed protein product [Aspergillus oryzae]GMG13187.1 unnamed protein product [Aspergillus oryzae]GMG24983.1 unnamed protein product [Aspergillus oryzae]GMG53354.1 unnamed protein product [Aspergillus oryzae var. brunneus]
MRRFERIYDVVEPVEEYPMEAITQYTSTIVPTYSNFLQRPLTTKSKTSTASRVEDSQSRCFQGQQRAKHTSSAVRFSSGISRKESPHEFTGPL